MMPPYPTYSRMEEEKDTPDQSSAVKTGNMGENGKVSGRVHHTMSYPINLMQSQ